MFIHENVLKQSVLSSPFSNLLKEECKARAQAVETLTIDKSAFEKRVIELTYAVKQVCPSYKSFSSLALTSAFHHNYSVSMFHRAYWV